ncbi:hypothetical protein FLO80_16700 [Aquicoccus porphyridii]|uniref:SAF domain-containing protein n=1 Tax=Aquicoccus porphyridii TaxID=1852029 RepID=A0A5A9Z550_9RHOB|nr:hypothetical protein [Aquicoccus porphyridii]KAA0912248.1 hypothetical protein FLO80_16700 [Aquicoccus porphyridii]RAI52903.1 hypothetical protein DOO74_15570 [Rhodobacteraceae bacterium AsT-22]
MRRKIWLFLAIGLFLSVASSAGIYLYLSSLENKLQAAQKQLERMVSVARVPLLTRDIARGERVTAADFKLTDITAAAVPDNMLQDLEASFSEAGSELFALEDFKAGQFLLTSQLATQGEQTSAGYMLPLNKRAHAISPSNLNEYSAQLSAGDVLDVYWRERERSGKNVTRLLATGLEIARPAPVAPAADEASGSSQAPLSARAFPSQAASSSGSEGKSDKLVIVGSAEDVANLMQAEKRGEFLIVPSNPGVSAADRMPPEPATDQKLAEKSEAELPADDEAASDTAPALAERAWMAVLDRASSSASDTSASADSNPTTAPDANLDVPGLFTLNSAPKQCQLIIVRSAARSLIEVPCQ